MIRLTPPLASEPMRVVYWARWADSAGNVGPFSATAVGWIEGGSHHLMPMVMRRGERPEIVDVSRQLIDEARQTTVIVAMMGTQRGMLPDHTTIEALPASTTPTTRCLEGPASEAA